MSSKLTLNEFEIKTIKAFIAKDEYLSQIFASSEGTILDKSKETFIPELEGKSQEFIQYVDTKTNLETNVIDIVQKIRDFVFAQNKSTTTATQKLQKISTSLTSIKGISKKIQEKLADRLIFDTNTLLSRCKYPSQRQMVADKLKISVEHINTWVKQADLWRVDGMTTDLAYLLVQAGVRGILDLAHVNSAKAYPILKNLQKAQPNYILGEEDLLKTVISNAKKMNTTSSFDFERFNNQVSKERFQREATLDFDKTLKSYIDQYTNVEENNPYGFDDDEPSYIYYVDENDDSIPTDNTKSLETPEGLFDFDPILPLPRLISGTVKINSNEKESSPIIPFVGAKVEIEGIVSPAEDKTEATPNPSCITDANGKFIITLPERYSIKETIKIIISNDKGKQEFIKNSTDVINSTAEYDIVSIAQNILYEKELSVNENEAYAAEKNLTSNSIDELIKKFKAFYGESDSKISLILSTLQELQAQKEPSLEYVQTAIMSAFDYILKNATLEAKIEGVDSSIGDDSFVVSRKVFFETPVEIARSLPKVKLMGEGDNAVMLSTDTAPSRMFSYSMMQSLIAPELTVVKNEKRDSINRQALTSALDVAKFKTALYTDPESIPQMSTLGLGYLLNMHQAWVPDGFALGDLLYSLILAPGEEQRLIVRENKQTYEINDTAEGVDAVDESYQNSQTDDTTAAYQYGVQQMMEGGSSYETQSSSWGVGASASGGMAGIFSLGISGSYSKSKSSGSSQSHQNNSQNEASAAAQKFQQSIKTASNRLAQAKRVSMSTATSKQSDSVATKIIANHNHSHAMTIQYWEVMRRYRIETAVDSVDLALFVPLKMIKFLGDEKKLVLPEEKLQSFDKEQFKKRYEKILKHAATLERALPYKYRSGLKLIQKYAACPKWEFEHSESGSKNVSMTFNGNFLTCDDLTATIYLKNGRGRISGGMDYYRKPLPEKCSTRDMLKTEIRRVRNSSTGTPVHCTFSIPENVSVEDISYISIGYSCEPIEYDLYQDYYSLNAAEREAYDNYQHQQMNFAKDDDKSSNDLKRMRHYMEALPEAYKNPKVSYSASTVLGLGRPMIQDVTIIINGQQAQATLSSSTLTGNTKVSVFSDTKTLKRSEFQKMEETLQHIVTETLRYSQAVWGAQSNDERTMMLAPYTIQMDFSKILKKDQKGDEPENKTLGKTKVPLLNCVNVHKVLGFYGNCIMLPFTFPEELANELGRTAADVQEQIYRFQTNSFRAPTTVITLPSKGMIGEAVLNQTNVSEVIDLTRFWNWKDSPIDTMNIDSSYLNSTDYLSGKSTKDISALNLQGATATEATTVPNLINALVSKQTPSFNDITGLDQLKDIVQGVTEASATGRDNIINKTSDLAKAAMEIQKDIELGQDSSKAKDDKKSEDDKKKTSSSSNSNEGSDDSDSSSSGSGSTGSSSSSSGSTDSSSSGSGSTDSSSSGSGSTSSSSSSSGSTDSSSSGSSSSGSDSDSDDDDSDSDDSSDSENSESNGEESNIDPEDDPNEDSSAQESNDGELSQDYYQTAEFINNIVNTFEQHPEYSLTELMSKLGYTNLSESEIQGFATKYKNTLTK